MRVESKMGCKILNGDAGECFYDSVTMTVFGTVMEDGAEAEEFQNWAGGDLRSLSHDEFVEKMKEFCKERLGK